MFLQQCAMANNPPNEPLNGQREIDTSFQHDANPMINMQTTTFSPLPTKQKMHQHCYYLV